MSNSSNTITVLVTCVAGKFSRDVCMSGYRIHSWLRNPWTSSMLVPSVSWWNLPMYLRMYVGNHWLSLISLSGGLKSVTHFECQFNVYSDTCMCIKKCNKLMVVLMRTMLRAGLTWHTTPLYFILRDYFLVTDFVLLMHQLVLERR